MTSPANTSGSDRETALRADIIYDEKSDQYGWLCQGEWQWFGTLTDAKEAALRAKDRETGTVEMLVAVTNRGVS